MNYQSLPLVYWYDTDFNSSEADLWFGSFLSFEYTCYGCKDSESCKWAWDEYNTHGDCLAAK